MKRNVLIMQVSKSGAVVWIEGYVIEQKPGQGREVSPCACRIAREKAKREAA